MPKLTAKRVLTLYQRVGLSFAWVADRRAHRGRQSPLPALIRLMVVGLCCGIRRLRQIEALSADVPSSVRRKLGLRSKRTSDTTLYEMLQRHTASYFGFREALYEQLRTDLDKKRIENDFFKGGVVSIDGKCAGWGKGEPPNRWCQKGFFNYGADASWRLMTLRASLTSSSARPVLDQLFLTADGEATSFPTLFERTVKQFPRLFAYVTADAGISSYDNAKAVVEAGKQYLFALKLNHRWLYRIACDLLRNADVSATWSERYRGKLVVRELRCASTAGHGFHGAKQFVSVTTTRIDKKGGKIVNTRLFITSIDDGQMSKDRLLTLVRLHWGIENCPNWTCDVVLEEDSHCPCRTGNGLTTMAWLNIIAYNIIAVFRSRSPRHEGRRPPWRNILTTVYHAFVYWEPKGDCEKDNH